MLGGQGLHLASKTTNLTLAKSYLKWLASFDTQKKWAIDYGLFSNRKSVAASGSFLAKNIFNPVFIVSYQLAKDYWRLPEYFSLLKIHSETLYDALLGKISPEDALKKAAQEEQAIINKDFPFGPYTFVEVNVIIRVFLLVIGVVLALST